MNYGYAIQRHRRQKIAELLQVGMSVGQQCPKWSTLLSRDDHMLKAFNQYSAVIVAFLSAFLLATEAPAALVVLDQDTVIDAGNSYPEPPFNEPSLALRIQDGPGGPPTVELRDGGTVGGYVYVLDDSHLVMTGGEIKAMTWIMDRATLTISGGRILPDIRDYLAVDTVTSVLALFEFATLHLRGGELLPSNINQFGSSAIHVYGHSFLVDGLPPVETSPATGLQFRGVYPNGQPFDFTVSRFSSVGQVFLHIVPEPSALALCVLAIGSACMVERCRRRSRGN